MEKALRNSGPRAFPTLPPPPIGNQQDPKLEAELKSKNDRIKLLEDQVASALAKQKAAEEEKDKFIMD